jgi:Flp pilus assembly protein TadG
MTPALHGLRTAFRRFGSDQSGIALIYATIALPVLVGMGVLAIDVSRLWSLQSSLQHAADALALAGAGELDRRTDSIVRANRAIDNLVSNNAIFNSVSAQTLINGTRVTRRYFTAIPGHGMNGTDADPMPSGAGLSAGVAADNIAAQFVEVTVVPTSLQTILPASFLGGSDTAQASATAVAGFEEAVCQFTPMFICNPYEDLNNTDPLRTTELYAAMADQTQRRKQIKMQQVGGGNGATYFPGNFGFLQPLNNPGANELREMAGSASPPACFIRSGVQLRTGAVASVRFGFNVRFDMYDGPMNSQRNNPLYRPASNVGKGYVGNNACNTSPVDYATGTETSQLRRDSCFETNTCTEMGGRMGNGNWDRDLYWQRVHGAKTKPPNYSNMSRYEVYKHEIATSGMIETDTNGGTAGGENMNPACYNGPSGSITNEPDRRIFYGAILNCRALDQPANGGPIQGGSSPPLPALGFGQFFLTEPVGGSRNNVNGADGDIWTELVGLVEPGQANSVSRDMVQLYR